MPDTRATILYCRLSRADMEQPGKTDAKFERYIRSGLELAAKHHLTIAPDDILCEQKSGGKLSTRPEMLTLLERCRRREVGTIVSADWDRLCRGDKRDEQDIEDALCRGRVTVVTESETLQFNDDDYDSLSIDVRSLLARQERRKFSQRVRSANRDRVKQGARPSGAAGYGYVWTKARYEQRQLVDPAHHEIVGELQITDPGLALAYARDHAPTCLSGDTVNEAAYLALARRYSPEAGALLPGVTCVSGEYAVLCEMARRAFAESLFSLSNELTRRYRETGSPPPPGLGRTKNASDVWQGQSLRYMLLNPYCAGYPAKRHRTRRDGSVEVLSAEEWTLSDTEQTYPHPLTLYQQEQLRALFLSRRKSGVAKPGSAALLTGILHCSEGRPMARQGAYYACGCHQRAEGHRNHSIKTEVVERAATEILQAVVEALPERMTTSSSRPDSRETLQREYAATRKLLDQKRAHKAFLTDSVVPLLNAWTQEEYNAEFAKTRQSVCDLEAEVTRLQSALSQPDQAAILSLGVEIRRVGFEVWWEALDAPERREFAQSLLERIEPVSPDAKKARMRAITVRLFAVIAPYYQPPDPYPLTHRFVGIANMGENRKIGQKRVWELRLETGGEESP